MAAPKCVNLPGRLWNFPDDAFAAADWLAQETMRTMLASVRNGGCTEDPLPIVVFSTSRSLEAVREGFDPEDRGFLSFVWARLWADFAQYQDASHRFRVSVDTYGDVAVALGPPNPDCLEPLNGLKASDRQLLKFSAMGIPSEEIQRYCHSTPESINQACVRLLKAMRSSQSEPPAWSTDDVRRATRCLTGSQLAAVVLRAAGKGLEDTAQLLSLDVAIVVALLRNARESLQQSLAKGVEGV